MRQVYSIRELVILALFAILAPFVHFYVQVYWSMLAIPVLPVSQSHVVEALWLFAEDFIGAALVAIILAVPLALLVRGRPVALALALVAATAAVELFTWQGSLTDLSALLTLSELATFFLLCWVVASVVAKRSRGAAYAP